MQMEVIPVTGKVIRAFVGETDPLTDEQLVQLNKNYLAFYQKYGHELWNMLTANPAYKELTEFPY
jgi:hypothetical protein